MIIVVTPEIFTCKYFFFFFLLVNSYVLTPPVEISKFLSGPASLNKVLPYHTIPPPTDNSAASKKYVDDRFSTASSMTQAQADGRHVRKTKIALGEWMDTFDDVNFVAYNWSKHVRKSMINVHSIIEIKVASFVTDMTISQLNKHKLVIGIAYVGSCSTVEKHLVTIALSGKAFSPLAVGSSGTMYSYHVHEEYYIGDDAYIHTYIHFYFNTLA